MLRPRLSTQLARGSEVDVLREPAFARDASDWAEARLAVLTCDSDWVHPDTMADAAEVLRATGLPVTFFVTDTYPVLSAAHASWETEPHPNFEGREDLKAALQAAIAHAPGATCYRGHSCFWSERLRAILRELGLTRSSSVLQYGMPGIVPFELGPGLTEIPIFWMDIFHLEYCELQGHDPYNLDRLALDRLGLKVLDVHPIHLMLNTESRLHYNSVRSFYQQPEKIRQLRHRGRGLCDVTHAVIERLTNAGYKFCLISEVMQRLQSPEHNVVTLEAEMGAG